MPVDQILAKVHNLTMREMPGGTMFPDVMQQYDDYSMREIFSRHERKAVLWGNYWALFRILLINW